MATGSIGERIRETIGEQLGIAEEERLERITPEASLVDDLGVDSLDIVELVMALEEEFDLEIPDEDAEKLNTVGQITTYLEEKLGSKT